MDEKIVTKSTTSQFISLLKLLWRKKREIVLFNGIVAVLALLYLLFIARPYYESTITILPDTGGSISGMGDISSLASMAGLNVGEASSTEIYRNLFYAESVLEPVFGAKYSINDFKDSINLYDYFKVSSEKNLLENDLQRERFVQLYEVFTKSVMSTTLDPITKILTIKVRSNDSKLSASVVNNIVSSLDDYVKTKRKSNAIYRRAYLEKRVSQVKDSLAVYEERLKLFQLMNRSSSQNPSLMLDQSRLMREVEILQGVYLELTKQLELAKLEEVKDTPIIKIREFARDPRLKSGPRRAMNFILIMIISSILTIMYFMFSKRVLSFFKMIKTEITKSQ